MKITIIAHITNEKQKRIKEGIEGGGGGGGGEGNGSKAIKEIK